MNAKLILLSVALLQLLNGCIKNNPDPSWLEVKEWLVEANPNSQFPTGELTHNITEAWVYVNNEVIGVFEVPFKIPVLQSGNVEIKIYPAIKNNGISATKKIYPFMEEYVVNTTLVQNEVLTLQPNTRYKDNIKFFIEDFEDASPKLIDDPNSAANFFYGNNPEIMQSFNGNFFGEVHLNNTTDTTWFAYTDFESIGGADLPRGTEVYLEIDYCNTNNLTTGLIAISPSGVKNNANIQLNAQEPSKVKWKKIYIDLRELISNSNQQAYFEHTFQCEIDEGDASGVIILDNIKVVHF